MALLSVLLCAAGAAAEDSHAHARTRTNPRALETSRPLQRTAGSRVSEQPPASFPAALPSSLLQWCSSHMALTTLQEHHRVQRVDLVRRRGLVHG